MRLIGHLGTDEQARNFSDYLLVNGISNTVEREDNGSWALWIHEEDQIDTASRQLVEYQAAPTAPQYKGHEAKANDLRRLEMSENEKASRRHYDRRRLFPNHGAIGVGPLTFFLIGICIFVAVLSGIGKNVEPVLSLFISEHISARGSHFLTEVRQGEIWRLLTPIFLHFGLPHLLFNTLALFSLGSMVEARQGAKRLLWLVVIIGVISNIGGYLIIGRSTFGGISGVLYGLFGYIWMYSKFDPSSGLYLDKQNIIIMMAWFFLCFTGMLGNIANSIHTVGLLLGLAWGFLGSRYGR
jgi:GlpG protein